MGNGNAVVGGLRFIGILSAVMMIVALALFVVDYGINMEILDVVNMPETATIQLLLAGSGALLALFGISKLVGEGIYTVFVEKISGIITIITGISLIILPFISFEFVSLIFTILVLLMMLINILSKWVDNKSSLMMVNLLFFLALIITSIMDQATIFFGVFAVAVLADSILILVASKDKVSKPKAESPKPKPVDIKPEPKVEPKKVDIKPEPKPEPVKVQETPKPVPKPVEVKAEPVKVEPEPEPKPADQLPKLKVMSSKDVAATRTRHVMEVPEDDIEPEPVEEQLPEYEVKEDTPGDLVRRGAWNKGLRHRKDYSDLHIPTAYVKGHVALYIGNEADGVSLEELEAAGWTYIHFPEEEITDGLKQAEEIATLVKANIKADTSKKKKTRK